MKHPTHRSRQRPNVRTLYVDIDHTLRRRVDRYAQKEDRTLRSVVERALRQMLTSEERTR